MGRKKLKPACALSDAMHVPSERECLNALRKMRWVNHKPSCVCCGSRRVVSNGTFGASRTQKFFCKKCGKNFNEKTGTPFQNSNVPLREWVHIATKLHKGEPISRISRSLKRRYGTVYAICRKARRSHFVKQFVSHLGCGRHG